MTASGKTSLVAYLNGLRNAGFTYLRIVDQKWLKPNFHTFYTNYFHSSAPNVQVANS